MKCVFNKITKKFTGTTSKWDDPEITVDEIILELNQIPDDAVRLNDTNDGLRPITQAEIDAEIEVEKDEIVDFSKVDPFLKAYVLAVNDGSIIPSSNMSPAELKAAVKAKL